METIAFLVAAAALPGGFGPVGEGKALCLAPDPLFKTCLALTRFSVNGPDRLDYVARMIARADGTIIVEERGQMFRSGDRWCEVGDPGNEAHMQFFDRGQPASPAIRKQTMKAFRKAYGGFDKRTVCVSVERDADGYLRQRVTTDGKPYPMAALTVRWVGEGDGFTLGI